MKALEIILWMVVPTAIYFWRAGLIGDNQLRERHQLTQWLNVGNVPFFLLTAVKVYLFWAVAIYMVFKALTGRTTASPWSAVARVDGKLAFKVVRNRGWGTGLTRSAETVTASVTVPDGAAASTLAAPAASTPSVGTLSASQAAIQSSVSPGAILRDTPEPPPVASPSIPQEAEPADMVGSTALSAEEELTREVVYSVAAACREVSALYDKCVDMANMIEKGRAIARSGIVNGVHQHPIALQSFAEMTSRHESEMTSQLQKLRELQATGNSRWSDFMFLTGAPISDFAKAMQWCLQHGIDSGTLSTIGSQGLILKCNFGLTVETFIKENDRLAGILQAE